MRTRSADRSAARAPQGGLTLPFAGERCSELLELLASSSRVDVDLQAIDDVGLAGVQILLSARIGAAAQGEHLALTKAPAGAFVAMFKRGGLLECDNLRDFWRLGKQV